MKLSQAQRRWGWIGLLWIASILFGFFVLGYGVNQVLHG